MYSNKNLNQQTSQLTVPNNVLHLYTVLVSVGVFRISLQFKANLILIFG